VLVACGIFFTLGVLLIPLAGIQTDEALFSEPLYRHFSPPFFDRIIHLQVSPMLMSYLGVLKTLVYYPIFKLAGVNLWTLRLPMVLLGALTIFIFYCLAAITVSRRAGILGAFILASDPIILMTDTFDWGPVAIEHFLLVAGCLCLVRFGAEPGGSQPKLRSAGWQLAAGFFCFGLALWNKAIFSWALSGLFVASILVLWPHIRRAISPKNVAIAAGAFILGAAPFIGYNVFGGGSTFRDNTKLVPAEIPQKWIQLELALQGSSLFGPIAANEDQGPLKSPTTVEFHVSAWMHDLWGSRHASEFYYALGVLLVLVPVWWRSSAAWFSIIFCAVSWLLMASTHGAGTGAHHPVLLWPFPILFATAVLDRLPRLVAMGLAIVLIAMNLTVVNQYVFQFNQNGTSIAFTDAIFPLSAALKEQADQTIYLGDWGMVNSLNLPLQGRLDLKELGGQLNIDSPNPSDNEDIARAFRDPNGLLVTHTAGNEIFPNVGNHLAERLKEAKLRREVLRVIPDSNGRPIFEISRIVPSE
jgi:hypothetical protein